MSAFVVTDNHINALVRFASLQDVSVYHGNPGKVTRVKGNEQQIAQLFLNANVASVNYRYNEQETALIEFDPRATALTPIEAIKAAQCLRYQSCEHPEYEGSLADKLIENIIFVAIRHLEGYAQAAWCIDTRVKELA